MSAYLLYNGRFLQSNKPIVGADNRGLRYGDGLFETLKFSQGTTRFANWHFERLFHGMQLLGFEPPSYFTADYLSSQIAALAKKNGLEHARIRINIIRGNGGLYDPENHFPNCIIQAWALDGDAFMFNENGLETGIYRAAKKMQDDFANLKSNNSLPYAMAALYAKKHRWNDALVLNSSERVCDASIANIFIIQHDEIFTCPLTEGCVAGITRRYLVENLTAHGFSFTEKEITEHDLMNADELFLTNSIKGIRWVQTCGSANYRNRQTAIVYEKMFKKTF